MTILLICICRSLSQVSLASRNQRAGTFYFNNEAFKMNLADLPTVVETHKTLDGKTFYKSADIGQVRILVNSFSTLSFGVFEEL